jgi:hypothetical protein
LISLGAKLPAKKVLGTFFGKDLHDLRGRDLEISLCFTGGSPFGTEQPEP